jgi:hypothetical protein
MIHLWPTLTSKRDLGRPGNPRAADLLCDLGLAIEELRSRDVTGPQAGDMSHSEIVTHTVWTILSYRPVSSHFVPRHSVSFCVVPCRSVSYHVRVLCHPMLRLFMAVAGFCPLWSRTLWRSLMDSKWSFPFKNTFIPRPSHDFLLPDQELA